jgi:hypothetical protein
MNFPTPNVTHLSEPEMSQKPIPPPGKERARDSMSERRSPGHPTAGTSEAKAVLAVESTKSKKTKNMRI